MSDNNKTFEQRLESLKKGCIILGILHLLSFISSLNSYTNGKGNISSVLFPVVYIIMLYFIFKYTKERNSIGPLLEKIYGVLLIIGGIILCLTIIGIIFGVIYLIVGVWIIKESNYFRDEIENGDYKEKYRENENENNE